VPALLQRNQSLEVEITISPVLNLVCRFGAKFYVSTIVGKIQEQLVHSTRALPQQPQPTTNSATRRKEKDEGPQGATDDSQARPEGQQTLQLPVVLVPVEAVQVLPRHKEKVLLLLQVLSVATFTSPSILCRNSDSLSAHAGVQ
jgi:hypothetical protein